MRPDAFLLLFLHIICLHNFPVVWGKQINWFCVKPCISFYDGVFFVTMFNYWFTSYSQKILLQCWMFPRCPTCCRNEEGIFVLSWLLKTNDDVNVYNEGNYSSKRNWRTFSACSNKFHERKSNTASLVLFITSSSSVEKKIILINQPKLSWLVFMCNEPLRRHSEAALIPRASSMILASLLIGLSKVNLISRL